MKKKIIIAVVILVSLFILAVAKDVAIKGLVTVAVSQTAGAPVHIDGFSLGIFNQSVKIKGFTIYQPKGYPQGVLVDISLIRVKYNLGALFKKQIHLPLVELDLNEVVIIKNQDGKFNVDALKVSQESEKAAEKKKDKKPVKEIGLKIDLLKLNLGRVISKEYTSSGEPTMKILDLNIKNKTYKNINSLNQLIGLILVESMKPAAIKGAGLYGAVSLAGVAFLPAAAALIFTGQDSISDIFPISFDKLFQLTLDIVKEKGSLISANQAKGVIKAKLNGAKLSVKIEKNDKDTAITVSARKLFLPKPDIAGIIVHEINQRLK
ncbi:MAG: AsmA family protein [Candidatus Omnitrophica bacterium]|nr:AsmA family protein [Candidatus Omnitrophota bacterium]MBU2044520.1 AsmA family protein [Candidatus Omnitrophota bacterium]MBU2265580.1 AsmA family protein [Candidatus Omnitrophota bacterium]MBU2473411.1 AsmA family protein [Candidatus Omnitrophota bacterium]